MIKIKEEDLIEKFGWSRTSSITDRNDRTIKEYREKILKEVCKSLIDFIGLKKIIDFDTFKEKLREACSGDGNEIKKITTAYSSSLCSLLFFYNVSDNNSLTLKKYNIEDELEKTFEFTKVLFEFKNIVISGGKPSNIDVVLLGKDKNNENNKVILFLESKFFEYYRDTTKKVEISKAYLNKNDIGKLIYDKNVVTKIFNNDVDFKISDKIYIYPKENKPCYIEGIKQMISHYIGVNNLLKEKLYESDNLIKLYNFLEKGEFDIKNLKNKLQDENIEIYLGEIIFDNIIGDFKLTDEENDSCFKNYIEKYKALAKILNKKEGYNIDKDNVLNNRIKVLEEPLVYSLFKEAKKIDEIKYEIKLEIKDDKIKDYYDKIRKYYQLK